MKSQSVFMLTQTLKKHQTGDLQIKKTQRGRASAFGVLVPLQSNKDHTCMHTAIDTGRHKERVIYAYMFWSDLQEHVTDKQAINAINWHEKNSHMQCDYVR